MNRASFRYNVRQCLSLSFEAPLWLNPVENI